MNLNFSRTAMQRVTFLTDIEVLSEIISLDSCTFIFESDNNLFRYARMSFAERPTSAHMCLFINEFWRLSDIDFLVCHASLDEKKPLHLV